MTADGICTIMTWVDTLGLVAIPFAKILLLKVHTVELKHYIRKVSLGDAEPGTNSMPWLLAPLK